MYTEKRLSRTAAVFVLGAVAVLAQGVAVASEVPVNWNVSPPENGAYREAFLGISPDATPAWVGSLGTLVASNSHVAVLPSRSNTWFSGAADTNALQLSTDAAAITNILKYAGGITNVSFASSPVFVDMRVQFVALDGTPDIGDAKLAVYVSSETKLHVRHNGGTTTNDCQNLTTQWHQLTVRMEVNKFDVLLDDNVVANDLVPIGANTELQSISFSGSGLIDDLYVSHGNPAYPGTMGTVPPTLGGFPGAGGPGVTNWLAQYFNDGRLAGLADFSAVSAAQLDAAYLLNEPLIGTELAPTNVPYAFGIQSFDLINPTTLRVTFKLETNGAPRSGQINGKIQLYGKVLAGDGWQAIGDPVAPTFAGDGTVTPADFSVSDTYRFFHPTIVAP